MIQTSPLYKRVGLLATFVTAAAFGSPAFAASTGAASPYTPQGSGTPAASGDYLTTNNPAGLNTFYRYFVEVPSGLSRLRVQIWDADIGAGTSTEAAAGRDRDRGGGVFTTTARYTLIDPAGKARPTLFALGNTTTPANSDNAWLSLFDGTGAGTGNFVADNFLANVYTNSDGNSLWGSNWTEAGDDNVATTGKILVNSKQLRIGGAAGTPSIYRQVNLTAAGTNPLALTTANFSFNWGMTGAPTGTVIVEVSANGGTTYTTLDTLTNASAVGARSYNITTSIAVNTRVRFRNSTGLTTANAFFFFDSIQIADAGGPLTAGHWELRVDESSTITAGDDINAFGVQADDGDATSAGTEIPIYIDSQNEFGVNAPASGQATRGYMAYPYITSGCTALENDFDYDSNQTDDVGSIVFTSRTGLSTQTISNNSLSTNDAWKQNTITAWTTDAQATDYGIWKMVLTINSYNDPNTTPNINGNYTTFYVGNSSLAAPPPTVNPVTNAFRVYLPADGAVTNAPAKPYVEQFVRYRHGGNPPTVGQTQLDTVTVQVTNPTAKAITFSATNLVTANVPGSGVVYAGNPQKTQGTVVSAPAIGGTGNITWNPGTVAAGAAVLLSYDINVTPTSAGQRLPAVGTVASGNGTKATWVDETGNTTQARATYTFGPLCELAINQGMLTEAVISSIRGIPADGGMAIEWRTASEAGTIGFDLYRRAANAANAAANAAGTRWVKVNRDLLFGLLTAPQGGTYRFVDAGASPREEQIYVLVEIEVSGRRRNHGPFTVRADWTRTAAGSDAYTRTAHPTRPALQAARPVPAGPTAKTLLGGVPGPGPLGTVDALHVAVRESGLYYLAASDLATRFGMQLPAFEKLVANGQLALSRGTLPVSWYPDVAGSHFNGIYFYGEAVDSLYTRDNVYRLERGTRGQIMTTAPASAALGSGPTAFTSTLHAEQDLLPATSLALDPATDYWFWDGVLSGDPTYGSRSFPLDAPGVVTGGGTASLTVHLQGASASGVTGEHHPTVSLNGTFLGEARFQGISAYDATFAVDPALLSPSGNQVQVTGVLDAGVPYSLFFIDSFDLAYPRGLRAAGGALAFTGAAGPVAVSGFGDPAVRLLDVTTPARPRWLSGAAVSADPQGGWDLSFQAGAAPYLAAATAGLKTPAAITPFRTPRLRSTANHADLVVLAGYGLHAAAQRLADYRSGQGIESMVVDFDEVTDEFAFGLPDPHAIPAFLAYARSHWRRAPRYLVLAGAGTVDYRDLLGYGGNLLPPLFVANEGGLFPSDATLADLSGNDSLPELAVGRIPAHSAAELDTYVDKVIAYENGADGAWTGSAIALADEPDRGADFGAGSDRVATFLTGYNVDRIYLGTTALEDARSRLLHDLQAGASLVDYMGHGGLDRLASGGLLSSSDVATLGNGPRVPVLTAMTCAINRFAVPGVSSLGELLIDQAGGGAAAVWAPSGLSVHSEAQLLAERFYRHLGDTDGARLGDLILRALQDFQSLGGSKSMIQIYNLLGDPALRVRRPTPGPGGPGSTSRE
jgi:hypothetical protein